MADLVGEVVSARLRRRLVFIESDCAEAMMLQDYDKLDRLCVVVDEDRFPHAVASRWGGDPQADS